MGSALLKGQLPEDKQGWFVWAGQMQGGRLVNLMGAWGQSPKSWLPGVHAELEALCHRVDAGEREARS